MPFIPTSHSIRDSDQLENGSRRKFGLRGVIRYVRANRRMSPGTVLGRSLTSKCPLSEQKPCVFKQPVYHLFIVGILR